MRIVLVPMDELEPGVLPELREGLRRVFRQEVTIGERVDLPGSAKNDTRGQYEAGTVLGALLDAGGGYDRVLGITAADLYVPGLNFVFGVARERNAVISFHRLRQSFYHLPEDREVFSRRVLVEAVHELGHTFGLSHCGDPACVMYFSQTIADTDRKGPAFCPACHPELRGGGGRR
ncbi:hypothetical protein ABH15_00365 [Methanoculleus taiwanensis]|uniref:Archaemetzincin n=1 Tax=Methanoculleus taiwanensis TaxID=1550565 RepID=A0A498H447_9EURY|nr:archaemetzincin family Zn-dependent metalloprotease [Methanoculleus taiwanensis]RXE56676.1 hypothetical protein ABH15_00365 [Methanoculleus taiwanensis]